MVMTLLGRHVPECEPQLMFSDHQIDFLRTYARAYALEMPDPIGDTVRCVAHLGGYQNR